ncbi:extracellular solute-binding protein [Cohnella sp. CFH 77786]|uniref:ABC transporter substrate-binding protein n=1 Tax=Cohnella sp. CFH 77786 TaxID=2662265 RepID=UPI001C60C32A|nr:extracellular solute-binding protein [Cohnella sp. CFH 77786]MBW5448224.1 extracellular solute-binding protein [Cohnella sp. CFH 77786]
MKISNLFTKWMSVGLISILSMALFAGCSSNQPTAEPEKQSEESKVEIEFFQLKPEAVDTYNEIIKKFESENPNIKVTQNNVPDAKNVLKLRMTSNDMPDIFIAYPNEAEFKKYVEEGYILDISDQKALENVNPNVLDSIKINNKSYSLPISLNTIGIFYNKAIFDQLKLSVPKTFSELIAAAEKIKAAGIVPFALSDKDDWTAGIQANDLIGMEMGKENADQFFADVIEGKQSTANNEVLGQVADKIIELRKYGPADASSLGYDQAISMFSTEKAAMFINGIWANPSVIKANPNLKYSMFPIPATEAGNTKVIYGIDAAVSISATTQHKEEAAKFLEFLSKTETAQLFADKDKSPSVIKGVKVNFEPIQNLTQYLDENKSFEWLHFKWPAGMEGQFNKEVQTLVVTKSKDDFFKRLDEEFKKSKK